MPIVTGATNKPVPFYLWPVGFRGSGNNNVTVKDIKEWEKENSPNFIKSQSYLALGGFGAVVLGAIISLFGIKQDNKLEKYSGSLLALAGAASSAGGAYASRKLYGKDVRVKDIEEIKKDILLLRDESLPTVKRGDAIDRLLLRENYPEGYEAGLAYINEKSKDEKINSLRNLAIGRVASIYWPYITDEFKGERKRVIETLLALAKDVDDDFEVRKRAIDFLGEHEHEKRWVFSNEEAIKILEVLKEVLQNEENQYSKARASYLGLSSAVGCIEKRLAKSQGSTSD